MASMFWFPKEDLNKIKGHHSAIVYKRAHLNNTVYFFKKYIFLDHTLERIVPLDKKQSGGWAEGRQASLCEVWMERQLGG